MYEHFNRRENHEVLERARSLCDRGSAPGWQYLELRSASVRPDTLDIIFSHASVPAGHFAMSNVSRQAKHHLLFINVMNNDFYQRGIPAVADSIEGAAKFMEEVAIRLGVQRVRTIGSSMGAYAAILYGYLLGADQVVACDAELELGAPAMRSWLWNGVRVYQQQWRNITYAARSLRSRSLITLSGYDPMEANTVLLALRADLQPVLSKLFHGNAIHLNWQQLFRDPERPVGVHLIVNQNLITKQLDERVLHQSACLHALASSGHARAASVSCEAARRRLPSVSLYDAILGLTAGNRQAAVSSLLRYVRFKRNLGAAGVVAEPLFDLRWRFGIANREMCDRLKADVLDMIDRLERL